MADRREQILAAADQLAAEHGWDALSVRAVAARAGVGASTLRYYFPSQQELVHAVVGRSFHAQLDDLYIRDATRSPSQRLSECMAQFLPANDAHISQLHGWLALYASALGPSRNEYGGRLLRSLQQHARDRVEGWLGILEAEDALRPLPRQRQATTLLAVIDGLCLDLLVERSGIDVTQAHRILQDVIDRVVLRTSQVGTEG